MNTKDKAARAKRRPIRALFHLGELNVQNTLIAFALLQIYFVCNLLSFGYWRESADVFLYLILFFGVWIIGLTLALALYLKFKDRMKFSRYSVAVLTLVTLPLYVIWVDSLQIRSDPVEWLLVLSFPFAVAIYYRLGQVHVAKIAATMVGLSLIAFMGHAGFTLWESKNSVEEHPNMHLAKISLDRTPNIHVIKFDALTHSAYSKEFMGVTNPAANYLSELDDAIYADTRGFQEKSTTRNAWATLFGLGVQVSGKHPFSGAGASPLTSILRNHGYKIHTGYSSRYFGNEKGPYIDFYYLGYAFSLICSGKIIGLCNEYSLAIFSRLFDDAETSELTKYSTYRYSTWSKNRNQRWAKLVLQLIRTIEIESTTPVFTAFHINLPNHTATSFEFGNTDMFNGYVDLYVTRVEIVRDLLREIDQLRLQFPDSIFLVGGDHGPIMSRGLDRDKMIRYWTLDRHAVALSLMNVHNLCKSSEEWLQQQIYLTPSRMIAASLACDGESRNLLKHFQDNPNFVKYRNFPSSSE